MTAQEVLDLSNQEFPVVKRSDFLFITCMSAKILLKILIY